MYKGAIKQALLPHHKAQGTISHSSEKHLSEGTLTGGAAHRLEL